MTAPSRRTRPGWDTVVFAALVDDLDYGNCPGSKLKVGDDVIWLHTTADVKSWLSARVGLVAQLARTGDPESSVRGPSAAGGGFDVCDCDTPEWHVKLVSRQDRLDRWTEQLATHGFNVCDCEEPCPPCARCQHAFCRHHDDGWLARQCLAEDCGCQLWLSDTDCPHCDGQGVVPVDPPTQAFEDRPCGWCVGSGVRRDTGGASDERS